MTVYDEDDVSFPSALPQICGDSEGIFGLNFADICRLDQKDNIARTMQKKYGELLLHENEVQNYIVHVKARRSDSLLLSLLVSHLV